MQPLRGSHKLRVREGSRRSCAVQGAFCAGRLPFETSLASESKKPCWSNLDTCDSVIDEPAGLKLGQKRHKEWNLLKYHMAQNAGRRMMTPLGDALLRGFR